MIVCPSCRDLNEEEASVCAKCGASLEPGVSALLPVRRTEEDRPSFELKEPKRPSKARPYVVLGALVVAVVGVGAFLLFRPDRCGAPDFESERFGYCVHVPEGWQDTVAVFGDVRLDQFGPPTESTIVLVQAVDLADLEGPTLEDWSARVQDRNADEGLTPDEIVERKLDGVGALQWDVTQSGDDPGFRSREVVAVRDAIGWRITLTVTDEGFATSAAVFEDMLDSWQFR